jgi:glycosyltransferase involved in cell wall biosynthesis
MNDKPLISVIIPSYNSARFVGRAVQSALAQTFSPIEVIVVDDGSTDDTRRQLSHWNGDVRYIHQPNGGPSKARNRGIDEARGELIAFLDSDDEWFPDKLTQQWECLKKNPGAGLVHTDIYWLHDADGQQSYVDEGKERYAGACYSELFLANGITASSAMITRSCLNRIGRFNEGIRRAEDYELWMRVARYFSIGYVKEPLVIYRRHSASASLNSRAMYEDEYHVLANALKADRNLSQILGKDRVKRRMFDAAFSAGYANVKSDDLRRARRYFQKAMWHDPSRAIAWAFWASSYLPLPLRKKLQSLKQWRT